MPEPPSISGRRDLVADSVPQAILTFIERFEQQRRLRVSDRLAGLVREEVLLRDVGHVAALIILGKEVVERLILMGPNVLWDRKPVVLSVREHWIDIIYHTPERIHPMADDLADCEFGESWVHGLKSTLVV